MLENFNTNNLTSSLKNQSQFLDPQKIQIRKGKLSVQTGIPGIAITSLNSVKTALFNIEHDKSLRIMVALPCS
jgi:hypothetical protein